MQEVGSRTDSVGSDWATSTLRGQTNWLNARTTELGERVDASHQSLNRLIAGFDALDRGIVMAAAIGSPFVRRGQRGSIDISMTEFGAKQGMAVGLGFRVSGFTQVNVAVASTHDLDETVMRFGAHRQY